MSKSADEIEHEVEESRARLDRTLDDLQSRLNVSDMARNLGGLRQSTLLDGGAERLMAEARANLVLVLLICAGLGYLVYDAIREAAARRRLARLGAGPSVSVLEANLAENRADRLNDRLDAGLEESFPGSDPVSVRITR